MRRFIHPRRSAGMLIAGCVVVAVAGGVAYAAIPGPDGVIHGCYQKQVGNLRGGCPNRRGTLAAVSTCD